MDDEALPLLLKLGFTTYEARAWLVLARATTLTGYEVAKRSSVPRANIYPVLKRLVERGAARRIESHSGVAYAATPAPELLENMRQQQQRLFAAADATLPRQPQPADAAVVYAVESSRQVYATAHRLVQTARNSLLIAVQQHEAAMLADDLRAANERGVKITTLCMEGCAVECGGCRGDIHRCELSRADEQRWLLVAADGADAMAAEFTPADGVRAIETRQPLIVELIASYVRQSAALAVLGDALGDHFDGLVSLQARQLLDGLQPVGGFPREVADATTEAAPNTRPATGITQENSP